MEQKYKQPLEDFKLELKDLDKNESKKSFTKINCPSCSSPVPAANLNINDQIGKCGNCDAVFSFKRDLEIIYSTEKVKIRKEINRPEGIDIFKFKDELDLSLKAPLLDGEILAMGFIPMFAFLFVFLALVGSDKIDVPSWSIYLATLIGLLPIWYSNRRKEHKLHLSVADDYLSVRWRPGKGLKDQHFHVEDIDQLYVKKFGHTYRLNIIVNSPDGQKHTTLVPKMLSISKAHYLEQELERHLGIVDREVPEEKG